MTYAKNALDGTRVYLEDEGGEGVPVVVHGGFLDPVALVRGSPIARALQVLPEEFRLIYVDHRGHGRSDKPHDAAAYGMPLRVADAVAVLDALGIERAHFIGMSWGGRLGFGLGEHAPRRVRSLVIIGQQPYAIDPSGPLARVVGEALEKSRTEGIEAAGPGVRGDHRTVSGHDAVPVPGEQSRSDASGVDRRDDGRTDLGGPHHVASPMLDLRRSSGRRLPRASEARSCRDPERGVRLDRR